MDLTALRIFTPAGEVHSGQARLVLEGSPADTRNEIIVLRRLYRVCSTAAKLTPNYRRKDEMNFFETLRPDPHILFFSLSLLLG